VPGISTTEPAVEYAEISTIGTTEALLAARILIIGVCPPPEEHLRSDDPWDCASGDVIAAALGFVSYDELRGGHLARFEDVYRQHYGVSDMSAGLTRAAKKRLRRVSYPGATVVLGRVARDVFESTFKVKLSPLGVSVAHPKGGLVFGAPHPSPRNRNGWNADQWSTFCSSLRHLVEA